MSIEQLRLLSETLAEKNITLNPKGNSIIIPVLNNTNDVGIIASAVAAKTKQEVNIYKNIILPDMFNFIDIFFYYFFFYYF